MKRNIKLKPFNHPLVISLAFRVLGSREVPILRRRENTLAGTYSAGGQNVAYTADFIRGQRARYYFD